MVALLLVLVQNESQSKCVFKGSRTNSFVINIREEPIVMAHLQVDDVVKISVISSIECEHILYRIESYFD